MAEWLAKKYKCIKLSAENNILLVTIDRPQARNSVDTDTALELFDAFSRFDTDQSLFVAVLTGAGGNFCAGADLKEISGLSQPGAREKIEHRFKDYGMGPMGPSKMVLSKPVIAAVEGYAVAGGLELALWCDLIVAHKEAVFGVFCRRFSVPLIDGGTIRLARCIGYSRAMDLILTGRPISGQVGFQWGLVNRLADQKDGVLREALQLAETLAKLPQECMRSDRLSLLESVYGSLEKDLRNEMRLGMRLVTSGHTEQGAQRFMPRPKI